MKGSITAKNGFTNEDYVVNKFNNWETDDDARRWLEKMEYDLSKIEYAKAVKLHGYKTDVQVQVTIKLRDVLDVQNLQVKLVSHKSGFNQIDKRWIDAYVDLWNIPENISLTLKQYTGEVVITTGRDPRRLYFDEMNYVDVSNMIGWFSDNKHLIVSDLMKGRGHFAAEWILVVQKYDQIDRSIVVPMNIAMNHYIQGPVEVTTTGNFKIGKIAMQRKGGDSGRKTATMLQFKVDPTLLFDV